MRISILKTSAAVVAAAMLAAGAATAAPQPKCFVKVNSGKTAAGSGRLLARKLAGAEPGDTIQLGGTCKGIFTISKDLTLSGGLTPDETFLIGGSAGTVLSIGVGAAVSIRNLIINGGAANVGGGILNEGDLTLGQGAMVIGNQGGGMLNSGTLLMTDDAVISVNFSANSGGGLFNTGTAVVEDNAAIRDNTSASPPFSVLGGGIYNIGTLVLRGNAAVMRNFANTGGGIFNDGNLTLEGNASVTDNEATSDGGGIGVGASSVVVVDPAWAGTTCDPANTPNDYDASEAGAACP
jgi:hypothetical protein